MKIKSWWSEDRQWFCVLVDDGICEATVSLTPEEAQTFIAELSAAPQPSSEEMLALLKRSRVYIESHARTFGIDSDKQLVADIDAVLGSNRHKA